MAENRHRTVLEITADPSGAEAAINRLQQMFDNLGRRFGNLSIGQGGGAMPAPGGVPGSGPLTGGGAAPAPPSGGTGGGGPGGAGLPSPPSTMGGGGGNVIPFPGGGGSAAVAAAGQMLQGGRGVPGAGGAGVGALGMAGAGLMAGLPHALQAATEYQRSYIGVSHSQQIRRRRIAEQGVVRTLGAAAGAALGAKFGAGFGAGIGAAFGGVGAVPGAAVGAVAGGIAGGVLGQFSGDIYALSRGTSLEQLEAGADFRGGLAGRRSGIMETMAGGQFLAGAGVAGMSGASRGAAFGYGPEQAAAMGAQFAAGSGIGLRGRARGAVADPFLLARSGINVGTAAQYQALAGVGTGVLGQGARMAGAEEMTGYAQMMGMGGSAANSFVQQMAALQAEAGARGQVVNQSAIHQFTGALAGQVSGPGGGPLGARIPQIQRGLLGGPANIIEQMTQGFQYAGQGAIMQSAFSGASSFEDAIRNLENMQPGDVLGAMQNNLSGTARTMAIRQATGQTVDIAQQMAGMDPGRVPRRPTRVDQPGRGLDGAIFTATEDMARLFSMNNRQMMMFLEALEAATDRMNDFGKSAEGMM